MEQFSNIKAILFDSGRVLNSPRTGHWFIPPNLFLYVNEEKFKKIDTWKVDDAFSKAMKYLEGYNFILTEEEEFTHFIEFYRIFAEELCELNLDIKCITEIARDTVYNDEKFLFFEDVFEIIPRLAQSYKLGVVSDTWPSLERVFRNNELRQHFSSFVMSSVLGVLKPHEKMFTTALDELGVKPGEALFIDDNARNLEGAKGLGMKVILMDREGDSSTEDYLSIRNLRELEGMIEF